jgi:3-isopropylmalate/(R)-2-methylmalate dehydratase small subunit
MSIIEGLQRSPGARVAVDLALQTVGTPDGVTLRFDVDPFVKKCLLEGLDEIGYTLTLLDKIEEFEAGYA